jgi:hypothetical protein
MYLAIVRVTLRNGRVGHEDYWAAPDGFKGFIDLRSPNGHGAEGFGLAAFDTDPSGLPNVLAVLSDDPEGMLAASSIVALQDNLGVNLTGARAIEAPRLILTRDADPTGQTKWKPLIPSQRLMYPVHLKAYSSNRVFDPDDPDDMGPVLGVVREDLSRFRGDALRLVNNPARWERIKAVHLLLTGRDITPEEFITAHEAKSAKVLGAYMLKYRKSDPTDFIKAGDARLEPRAPETVITDDFNRIDATNLGANWTQVSAFREWTIAGNMAVADTPDTQNSIDRYDGADLSSDDHYVQFVNVSNTESGTYITGPCARFQSDAETYYRYMIDWDHPADDGELYSVATGTATLIGGDAVDHGSPSNNLLKVQCDGSTISATFDGGDEISVTDTAITGNVRGGMFARTSSAGVINVDDFEEGDLAAGPVTSTGAQSVSLVAQAASSNIIYNADGAQTIEQTEQSASVDQIFEASGAQTTQQVEQVASGDEEIAGAGAQVIRQVEQAAEGISPIVGEGNQTTQLTEQVAFGDETIDGTGASVTDIVEQEGNAAFSISADGAQVTEPVAQSGSGNEEILGAGANVVEQVEQLAEGDINISASADQTIAQAIQTASAIEEIAGMAALVIAAVEQLGQSSGTEITSSAANITQVVQQAANAILEISGSGSQIISPTGQAASAEQFIAAAGASIITAIWQAANGNEEISGASAQIIAAIEQLASATQIIPGDGASIIQPAEQSGSAVEVVEAVAALVIAFATQAGNGNITLGGNSGSSIIDVVEQLASGNLTIGGDGEQTVALAEQSGNGIEIIPGQGSNIIAATEQVAQAIEEILATSAQSIAAARQSGSSAVVYHATAALVIRAITQSGLTDINLIGAGNSIIQAINQLGSTTVERNAIIQLIAYLASISLKGWQINLTGTAYNSDVEGKGHE